MEQSQQLTKLIEKALENGWMISPFLDEDDPTDGLLRFRSTRNEEHISFTSKRGAGRHISIETLLFGDNLSFLKALVGEKIVTSPPMIPFYLEYHRIAAVLVITMEIDRIPWLYSQVVGEEQE